MSNIKIQFFMDKLPTSWKLIGYETDLKTRYQKHYWDNSQYVYNGKVYDVHVMNRSSVYPPIKMVLKMVSQYMELHISE